MPAYPAHDYCQLGRLFARCLRDNPTDAGLNVKGARARKAAVLRDRVELAC